MKMWIYIIRRIILLIPVIVGVMTVTFVLLSALPITEQLISAYGNPKTGWHKYDYAPACPNNESRCLDQNYATHVHALGLDQPIYEQWAVYMKNSLTLSWGATDPDSHASQALLGDSQLPVITVLSYFLPYTLELAILALIIILALAIPLGNYSAVYRNRPLDQGARVLSFSGFALPGFLFASLLLLGVAALTTAGGGGLQCHGESFPYLNFYGSWPNWYCLNSTGTQPSWIGTYYQTTPTGFPTVDALIHGQYWLAGDTVFRLILPALVIAYGSIAIILRYVRNSMLEVMSLDYIRTARAKGVPESQVIRRHAGRNSLNVTITILGLAFAGFIGGFPIIELIFNLKGVGLLLAYSILPPFDFHLIFGTVLLFTIIVVSANIIVDVLYAYLDPRVRLG
jgi:peptide/nickel transport system permease protein